MEDHFPTESKVGKAILPQRRIAKEPQSSLKITSPKSPWYDKQVIWEGKQIVWESMRQKGQGLTGSHFSQTLLWWHDCI